MNQITIAYILTIDSERTRGYNAKTTLNNRHVLLLGNVVNVLVQTLEQRKRGHVSHITRNLRR